MDVEEWRKSREAYATASKIYLDPVATREDLEDSEMIQVIEDEGIVKEQDSDLSVSDEDLLDKWEVFWREQIGSEVEIDEKKEELLRSYFKVYFSKVEE